MFDWISSTRTTRDLTHLGIGGKGYNGWSLANVPNPTDAALVIVHDNGKLRSNITTTRWTR